jgi:hypothetical protein
MRGIEGTVTSPSFGRTKTETIRKAVDEDVARKAARSYTVTVRVTPSDIVTAAFEPAIGDDIVLLARRARNSFGTTEWDVLGIDVELA